MWQSNTLAVTRSHEESSRASSELAFVFAAPASVELFVQANQDWNLLSAKDVLRLRALIQAAMNYFETFFTRTGAAMCGIGGTDS